MEMGAIFTLSISACGGNSNASTNGGIAAPGTSTI
jgi:hypothetical protein